jgi:competence protein ComGC
MYNKKKKGFTLIEFLIYMGIVTFFMTMIVLSAINMLYAKAKIIAMGEVNHNARFIMERITYNIRSAESISSASEDTLILEMSPAIYNPMIFSLEEGSVVISRGGLEAVLNTDFVRISRLNFIRVGEKGVEIEVVVDFFNPANRQEYDFSKTFRTTENIRK